MARIALFGAVIAAILGTGACSTLNDVQSPRSARDAAAAKSGHQFHDRYRGTIPAVPKIIDALRQRGYTVVTVSQLLAPAVAQPGAVYRP
jgi:peptidoglycan/xylan/chitin deacetylase (PgdA/CDA1 family)